MAQTSTNSAVNWRQGLISGITNVPNTTVPRQGGLSVQRWRPLPLSRHLREYHLPHWPYSDMEPNRRAEPTGLFAMVLIGAIGALWTTLVVCTVRFVFHELAAIDFLTHAGVQSRPLACPPAPSTARLLREKKATIDIERHGIRHRIIAVFDPAEALRCLPRYGDH